MMDSRILEQSNIKELASMRCQNMMNKGKWPIYRMTPSALDACD